MKRLYELLFSSPAERVPFLVRLGFVLLCSFCVTYGMSGLLMMRLMGDVVAHQQGQPLPSQTWFNLLFAASLATGLLVLGYLIFYAAVPRLLSIGIEKWYATLVLLPYFKYLFFLFLLLCPPRAFARKADGADPSAGLG
jgi:hypothetical protein